MGRRLMRALGAGLTEAGRQSEITRREQLEKLKIDNLNAIQNKRASLYEKQVNLQAQSQQAAVARQEKQDARQAGLDTQRNTEFAAGKVGDVISAAQARADALIQPGDVGAQEYAQQRSALVKGAGGLDGLSPEELQKSLTALQDNYMEQQLVTQTAGTPEYKQRKAELSRYVKEINNLLDTTERKVKRADPSWDGDVSSLLYLDSRTRDQLNPPPQPVMGGGELSLEGAPDLGTGEYAPGYGGGEGPAPFVAGKAARDTALRAAQQVVPGMGGALMQAFGPRGLNEYPPDYIEDAGGRRAAARAMQRVGYGTASPALGAGVGAVQDFFESDRQPIMAQAPRRLDIDPATGRIRTPGAGLPGP